MVTFLVYATRPELFAQEILHINSLLGSYNTRSLVITDRTLLICQATQLKRESSAILLFVSSDEELEDLILLKEHFGTIPTILVLPNDKTATLQKGMLLYPLFFMARHAELNQFSVAVNELCRIYQDHFHRTDRVASFNPQGGMVS